MKGLGLLLVALLTFFSPFLLPAQEYAWTKVARMTGGLQAIFFVDSLHGWAAGGTSPGIYQTTDGGLSWIAHPCSTYFVVKAFSFVDTLHGWCTGDDGGDGYILETVDGGRIWARKAEMIDRHMYDIHAITSSKLVAVGSSISSAFPDSGILLQSRDGGKSWKEVRPDSNGRVYRKIQFLDTLNGFIYGFSALRTRDGGSCWQALPMDKENLILSPSFIDTLRGWGGHGYAMYHTADGGISWSFMAQLDQPEQLFCTDVSFTDSLNGWAFGNQFYEGGIADAVYRTTDGGFTWMREEVAVAGIGSGGIIADQMLEGHLGWAISSTGTVLKYQMLTPVIEKLPSTSIPRSFSLRQNYPNPFNPSTLIEYELPTSQRVWCEVTNALGEHVRTILDGVRQASGTHSVEFDGRGLPSGTYFYTLRTEHSSETKAMTLMK